MTDPDPDPGPGPRRAGESPPVRFTLLFDVDRLTLGVEVEPPEYPLSKLIEKLPEAAAQVLGWIPAISVTSAGLIVDPVGRAVGLYSTAGAPQSAAPSATLFLADVPLPGSTALLVGLALDSPIDLSGAPLFGALLDGLSVEDLSFTWASAEIPPGRAVLPRPAPPAAEQTGFPAGPELSLSLRDGENREELRLRPPDRKPTRAQSAGSDESADPTDLADPVPTAEPEPSILWFPVEKRLGPLTLGRVGVVSGETAFGLALDASLRLASLSVRLTGFTLVFDPRSDISPAALRVALDGLAVAFGSGKLRIDGGLVRTTEWTDEGPVTAYAGSLVIQAGPYGITAIGSFAQYRGAPSLFVFGLARGRFGGVPAFFVTGLAAGFGYNRRLRLPSGDEVRNFPLVRAVTRGPLGDPGAAAEVAAVGDAGSALAELSSGGWVPIAGGSYWVAAGIAFTSFGVLDGFALLIVQFGERFIVALLGVVALRLPKIGPPYVYVELTLDAVLDTTEGEFRANASLTPNSFVFHPDARLAGGFAFRLWFGSNPRAGDFVATIGGYHPAFDKPDWYPVVPRLSFGWNVSEQLSIAGDAYMAVTPTSAMAGGNLELKFQVDALKAWFSAHADLIMNWRPFFFDVRITVSIGASYTLSLGSIHRTLTVALGADLALWGPPFTGVADVRWTVISFTVSINGGTRPALPAPVITWAAFEAGFLPVGPDDTPTTSSVCRPRAAAGLLDTVEVDGATAEWLVDGGAFALLTESAVPASLAVVEGPDGPGPEFYSPQVGVYPMGSLTVTTVHRVSLTAVVGGVGGGVVDGVGDGVADARSLDLSGWDWSAVRGQVPYALWGTVNTGKAVLGSELLPAMTGVRGAPRVATPDGPPPVPLELLENTEVEPRRVFRLPGDPIDGSTGEPAVDSRTVIRDTITETVDARASIARLLARTGVASGVAAGRMDVLAERIRDVFTAEPMLGPPGTTGPQHPAPPAFATATATTPRSSKRPAVQTATRPTPVRRNRELAAVFSIRQGHDMHAPDAWAPHARSARAHVFDSLTDPRDALLANRHVRYGAAETKLRVDTGINLLLTPRESGRRRLFSDGGLPIRVTAFDRQALPIDEASISDGSDSYLIPEDCDLLLVSGPDDPEHESESDAVRGWSATTPLLLLAPQALLAGRTLIRPQAPVRMPIRSGHASRGIGVISGRTLAMANRVETPRGIQPGWIDTLLPAATTRVRLSLRPSHAITLVGSGPRSAPVRVTARRGTGPGVGAGASVGIELVPLSAGAVDGRLRLIYEVVQEDSAAAGPGPLTIRVTPDQDWIIDAVLGDPRPTDDSNRPAPQAIAATHASGRRLGARTATAVLR